MCPAIETHIQIKRKMKGQIGSGGNFMWGMPLVFWESVFFWATITAAVAGGISVTAAFISAIVGYQVTDLVQREANERISKTNERAANAELRAAEANLALEKLKAPRVLSPQEQQLIVSKVNKFSGQEYQVTTYWDLKEAVEFSKQLSYTLATAGWKFIQHESPSMLFAGTSGVQVWVHINADPKVNDAANALVSALEATGNAPALKQMDPKAPNNNKIVLNVGTKP